MKLRPWKFHGIVSGSINKKISLNVKKTEMVIFKSKLKKLEGDLKIKLSGKRLYSTENVKYISGCKN